MVNCALWRMEFLGGAARPGSVIRDVGTVNGIAPRGSKPSHRMVTGASSIEEMRLGRWRMDAVSYTSWCTLLIAPRRQGFPLSAIHARGKGAIGGQNYW